MNINFSVFILKFRFISYLNVQLKSLLQVNRFRVIKKAISNSDFNKN